MLAQEWIQNEGDSLIPFELCCDLLGFDSELVRVKAASICGLTPWIWLIAFRAVEQIACHERCAENVRKPDAIVAEPVRVRQGRFSFEA